MPSTKFFRLLASAAAAVSVLTCLATTVTPAKAATLVPVTGAGSTWSSNAMEQWIGDVNQYGIKIDFAATGSSDGRTQFKNGTVDFGVSEIPYGITDNGTYEPPPTSRSYAYMPIVAGGTSFMYQLHINGQQVTNLRLSGPTIAGIFTGNITKWNDPAIVADNPGIVLPAEPVVPVVRSDGSGTTAQLTTWMSKKYPDVWNAYCAKAGRVTPCGVTSTYPTVSGYGFISQQLSTGVAGYITQSQSEGTIGYVETSYAIQQNYPVAKMLNAAGYFTAPTASNVAVALTAAQINTDPTSPSYLTQVLDGVYANPDPRTYPLSSYSYMIIPTALQAPMTSDKGYTLGKFAYYFLCEGQQAMGDLGYSPLPVNLVQAALDQVKKIPGVAVENTNISQCNNPTFSTDGTNLLATTAVQPLPCDQQSMTMCPNPTGGATQPTYVAAATAAAPTTPPAGTVTAKPKPGTTKPPATATKSGSTKPAAATTKPATAGVGSKPVVTVTVSAAAPTATVTLASPATVPGKAGVVAPTTTRSPGVHPVPAQVAAPPTQSLATDPVTGAQVAAAAPSAAAGTAASGAPQVAAAPLRAVPVALAVTSGWTFQDSLVLLAIVMFVSVVVVPPLLSRRLAKRAR